MKTLSSAVSSLLLAPLFPSLLLFVFSIAACIVLSSTTQGTCPNLMQAHVIGSAVIGYGLPFVFGLMLVLPSHNMWSVLWVAAFASLWVLTLVFAIIGSVALGRADSNCVTFLDLLSLLSWQLMYIVDAVRNTALSNVDCFGCDFLFHVLLWSGGVRRYDFCRFSEFSVHIVLR